MKRPSCQTLVLAHKVSSRARWLVTALGACSFTPTAVAQQYSQLWGQNGELWNPATSLLRDFTNVGYMGGTVPIPNWPVGVNITDFGAIPNDGIDDSQAIINAIAACPNNHAVLVPKGKFTILQKIIPARNHFVLRGEHMYESVLFFPKYVGEAYIEQVGWTAGRTSLDRNFVEDAFLQMNGGTGKSIENLSFEFREQRKASPWDYPGANAISYNNGITNSWVRNVYMKNYDLGIGVSGTQLSFINIIADQFYGRQATDGDMSGKLDAFSAILPRNSSHNLYHNIDITGVVLQPIDLNGSVSQSVFSKIRTSEMNSRTVAYHGGGSQFNLYTDLNRPVVGPFIDGIYEPGSSSVRSNETYWGAENSRLSDDTWSTSTNRAIFVGYGNDWATRIDTSLWNAPTPSGFWYEPDVPNLVIPRNLYLAQLARLGEPLPENLPSPVPAPYEMAGDVIRMLPTDDITPGKSSTGELTAAESYLKFDLTGANEPAVAHARLRLTFKSIINTPFRISAWTVTDDSWSEATLTTTNKPAAVTELDSKWIMENNADLVVEFDVTAFVRGEMVGGDGVISLCVNKMEGNGFLSSFWSSELGVHPELVIERTASSVPGPPSAPKGIRSTPLVGNIILDWDDNNETDVETYKVYRTPYDYGNLPVAAGLVTSDYVDTSSESDWHVGMMDYRQVYRYWITAVDDHGYESPRSDVFVAATLHPTNAPPTFNAAVNLAAGTAAANYAGSLAGTASDPESDPLFFMKVSGPNWLKVALDGTLSGTPGLADEGLHTFTFQVTAIGGNALKEVTILVGPPVDDPVDAPAPPTSLNAVPGDGAVALNWNDNAEPNLVGYKVYRAFSSSGPFTVIAASLGTSSYTDQTAMNGTTYHYYVTAVNTAVIESAASNGVSASPLATPPPGPTAATNLLGGLLTSAANWTNGLPVGQLGGIAVNATADTTVVLGGYNILHTAGTVQQTGLNALEMINDSSWVTDGPTATTSTGFRGFTLKSNSSFTLNQGTINTLSGRDWAVMDAGSSLTVNGGTLNLGRHLLLSGTAGPTFTINGGVINGNVTAGDIGSRSIHSNAKALHFNGGTTSVFRLDLAGANTVFHFGGTEAGSLTATNFAGTIETNSFLNFLPGTQMAVTLSATNEWAATQWAAGKLRYNGQGNSQLGSWAAVTATGGLGGGYRFAYDSGTETLSLTTAPSDDPPAAPTGLAASSGIGPVSLDWANNSEGDLAGYSVYRSNSQGSLGQILASGLSTSHYVDTNVVDHTTYHYTVTAVDLAAQASEPSSQISARPGFVTHLTSAEVDVYGTLTGSVGNVDILDNSYQSITEISNGSTSLLEHVWVFNITPAEIVTFVVEAHHSPNSESDRFIFAFSTDEVNYTDMLTADKTAADGTAQYYVLPSGTSGTVYVRVRDTDRSAGNNGLDSINIDQLVIESETSSTPPAAASAPSPADSAVEVSDVPVLHWKAGRGTVSHEVYFGTTPTPDLLGVQAGTDSTPGLLLPNTTYYWSVSEVNSSGTTAGPLWSFTTGNVTPKLSTGMVGNISSDWQTIELPHTYHSPVVVASVVYSAKTEAPAVARVRNAAGNSLELKVQNPSGLPLSDYDVHLVVIEEGVYTAPEHGVNLEALKVDVAGRNENNNWNSSQQVQILPTNSFTSPVVLGQVMTANDGKWSVFWSSSANRSNPASASSIHVGRHIGEDTDLIRTPETLGVIIVEAGSATFDGVNFTARVGTDSVSGIGDNPPYSYPLTGLSSASGVAISSAAMDGNDGGWPVLLGGAHLSATHLSLAIDEDQISDPERLHSTEQVSYLVFE